MVFVAPNPKQNAKYLSIVLPMSPLLWLIILISMAFTAVVFVIVSKSEEQVSIGPEMLRQRNHQMLSFSLVSHIKLRKQSK